MQKVDYIAEAIEAHYGPRCPDFDAECACCLAWERYDALSAQDAGAIAGVRVKALEWSEPLPPNENCSYDHASANGMWKYLIEWQSWKDYKYYVIYRDEGFIGVEDTLEAAKAAAQIDYERRILSALEPTQELKLTVAELDGIIEGKAEYIEDYRTEARADE